MKYLCSTLQQQEARTVQFLGFCSGVAKVFVLGHETTSLGNWFFDILTLTIAPLRCLETSETY
jgi:hypothetical protein